MTHVPVRHQVEAALERAPSRAAATGAAASPEALNGHEHLARLAVLDELEAPEAAEARAPRRSTGGVAASARELVAGSTSPIAAAFSTMPSSWNASIDATADAHASGWPA